MNREVRARGRVLTAVSIGALAVLASPHEPEPSKIRPVDRSLRPMTDVLPEVSCQHGIGGGDLESPADTSNDPACIVAGAHDSERKLQMFNRVVFAAIALAAFQFAFAQQTPPDAAASGAAASAAPAKVVKKRLHPLKLRKGAIAASNPETTPFKQGGE